MAGMTERNILSLIREIGTGINVLASGTLKHEELSPARMYMLSEILRLAGSKKEIPFSTLVKETNVSKAAVSTTLRDLKELKYLDINTNRNDRRRKIIAPTFRAINMKSEMEKNFSKMTETLFSGIDGKEQRVLEFILRKIIRNMKDVPDKEKRIQDDSITDLYQGI